MHSRKYAGQHHKRCSTTEDNVDHICQTHDDGAVYAKKYQHQILDLIVGALLALIGCLLTIYSGDSYSQTGFDPTLQLANAANPIGNPGFPGYTTTGGDNWLGFYITQFNSTPVYSYNFAYGGATTDANLVAPYEPTVLSFVDQVTQYENSVKTIPNFASWTSQNSLWAVWMGVNDVGNGWYESNWSTLLGEIMTQYINQTQTLYNSGARKFLFLTVPPIQLTPSVASSGASNQALEAAAIAQYNQALTAKVAAFKAANAGVTTYVLNTTTPFMTAINNPTAYGAPNASCYDASGTACLWWNDVSYSLSLELCVEGSRRLTTASTIPVKLSRNSLRRPWRPCWAIGDRMRPLEVLWA